jgi:hypothetical protein
VQYQRDVRKDVTNLRRLKMGIILISLALICLCVFLNNTIDKPKSTNFWDDDSMTISGVFGVIGVAVFFLSLMIWLIVACGSLSYNNEYEVNANYFEAVSTNNSITPSERDTALIKFQYINKQILDCRTLKDNFWIGIFYIKEASDKQTFDLSKIKTVNNRYQLNQKIEKE